MAGGMDQVRATAILAAFGINASTATVGTMTITGPQKIRLMTANGSDSANGTEQGTSGGYTAGGQSITMGTAATGSISNTGADTWTSMPSCTLTGMEQWDSSGTPLRLFWAPWASGNIVVASGNTFTIAIAGYTPSLA